MGDPLAPMGDPLALMAEVMVSKRLFQEILERIGRLKPVPLGYG